MKCYKVKPEYDNKRRYVWNSKGERVIDGILIANEIYTIKEFEKLAMSPECFEKVNAKNEDLYFFFGARFMD